MQSETSDTQTAQHNRDGEGNVDSLSQWTVSTYRLRAGHRTQALVQVDHPNNMGTNEHNGLSAEKARLSRFRGHYISKKLHDAATGQTKGIVAILFRRFAGADFLAQCTQKTCFRKEERTITPPPPAGRLVYTDNGVTHAVERSASALAEAAALYGAEVIADVQLGFSKPISLPELRAPNAELPLVDDCIPMEHDRVPEHEEVLSVVISYRHSTEKRGHILNVSATTWTDIVRTAATLCEAAGRSAVRFWTDQILSRRKPSAALRWVSSGVLPYSIYPVLYVHSDASQLRRNLRRMWISVEHLMATFGQGIVHVGKALGEDELPMEWPSTFLRVSDDVNWMLGLGHRLHSCVRKLCSALMCGLVRNKEMSWPGDAQDLLDWASAITSALLFRDIAHSFDCNDCRLPTGYTSEQRLMALYSTGVVIDPQEPESLFNETHPRLDVPAVSLEYDGRAWDGFREWIPESCLWGRKADEDKKESTMLMSGTRALVMSHGGSRAVAVLQFCSRTTQETTLITAHLLVRLTDVRRGARQANVEWSKRFWPVYPLQMWNSFEAVWRDTSDRNAFVELGENVGASSGLDYTDLTGATDVKRLTASRIRWR